MIKAIRYHDICCGHRVCNHESKCRHLHGHNYRVHFHCVGDLDAIGRVIDFSVIKELLCNWLEENWDHYFLIWKEDPLAAYLREIDSTVIYTPFNPTAENMANYLLTEIAPGQLIGTGVTCCKVIIEETRKCSVEAAL